MWSTKEAFYFKQATVSAARSEVKGDKRNPGISQSDCYVISDPVEARSESRTKVAPGTANESRGKFVRPGYSATYLEVESPIFGCLHRYLISKTNQSRFKYALSLENT